MKPRWETFEVSESERFPELQGRRVSDLARERGCSPLDVMCEIAVAEDLATRFRAYIANDDVDAVGRLLTHDQRRARPLRRGRAHRPAVRRAAAHRPARHVGARARCHAARARGAQADRRAGRHVRLRRGAATCARATGPTCACSIRHTVGTGPTRRVRDFPADAERLTAEEPTGVRHVLVNGTPIRVDEAQVDAPSVRPGMRPETACGPDAAVGARDRPHGLFGPAGRRGSWWSAPGSAASPRA